MDDKLKRYLLPPIVALPIIVGFLFILIGGAQGGGTTMILLGTAILVGNAAFWPLLFTWQGKREKEKQKEEARQRAREMKERREEE